ncbi:hypothetical protein GCK72_012308 [Caenorhabditis remanei]|uniref:F-box domain-containing protein n=1 Tax=Caenorhabditis remanei TaxID=31234 RepID=A0A6A5GKK6_CAERE|nr:hypothetical protein GCK72_012308 [Caenorhabditis remanei]KAF1755857.1 hypothetical protein GCK72_012308 [Caenorhabditis remanei]
MKILRFPMLVIKDVLKNMDSIDLINLSLASKKMGHLISLADTHRFKVDLEHFLIISINEKQYNIQLPKNVSSRVTVMITIDNAWPAREWLHIYWNKKWTELLVHILRVFKSPLTTVNSKSMPNGKLIEAIQILSAEQCEIKKMYIHQDLQKKKSLRNIIESLNITERLITTRMGKITRTVIGGVPNQRR